MSNQQEAHPPPSSLQQWLESRYGPGGAGQGQRPLAAQGSASTPPAMCTLTVSPAAGSPGMGSRSTCCSNTSRAPVARATRQVTRNRSPERSGATYLRCSSERASASPWPARGGEYEGGGRAGRMLLAPVTHASEGSAAEGPGSAAAEAGPDSRFPAAVPVVPAALWRRRRSLGRIGTHGELQGSGSVGDRPCQLSLLSPSTLSASLVACAAHACRSQGLRPCKGRCSAGSQAAHDAGCSVSPC